MLVVMAAFLAGCSSSAARSSGQVSARPHGQPAATATREGAAQALADRMLTEAIVPRNARPSNVAPPSILPGPYLSTGLPRQRVYADAHRLWTVSAQPRAVIAFATANVPRGFTQNGAGSESLDGVTALQVDQPLSKLPANVFSAELEWAVTAAGAGSLLRVDAVVGWSPLERPGTPRLPAIRVAVGTGCPPSLARAQDVDNPAGERGPLLLPALSPTAALICSYDGGLANRALSKRRLLDGAQAKALASVIRGMVLMPDLGAHGCPMDVDATKVLAFSYRDHPDADLWWHASGCQSLDNGYLYTTEGGNPSFYNGLAGALQHLPG